MTVSAPTPPGKLGAHKQPGLVGKEPTRLSNQAVREIWIPIFFEISCSAFRTRQRAYRYIPATTTPTTIAPAPNHRRSRETGRPIAAV